MRISTGVSWGGLLCVGILAAALAGCETAAPPPPPPKPHLGFAGEGEIAAPAGVINFVNAYQQPGSEPYIEHEHDIRPETIVQTWMSDRLRTTPHSPGRLKVTVTQASVVRAPAKMESGPQTVFKRQAEFTLTGKLTWHLTYFSPSLDWNGDGTATSVRPIMEQASVNDMDAAYASVIEGLAANFDKEMQDQLAKLDEAVAKAGPPGTN